MENFNLVILIFGVLFCWGFIATTIAARFRKEIKDNEVGLNHKKYSTIRQLVKEIGVDIRVFPGDWVLKEHTFCNSKLDIELWIANGKDCLGYKSNADTDAFNFSLLEKEYLWKIICEYHPSLWNKGKEKPTPSEEFIISKLSRNSKE